MGLEAGVVYTRGEYYGDPVWLITDYGDDLFLMVMDFGKGKRKADYKFYVTKIKDQSRMVALDPEDADKFKMQVTLAVVRELQKRCERRGVRNQAVMLWSQSS